MPYVHRNVVWWHAFIPRGLEPAAKAAGQAAVLVDAQTIRVGLEAGTDLHRPFGRWQADAMLTHAVRPPFPMG